MVSDPDPSARRLHRLADVLAAAAGADAMAGLCRLSVPVLSVSGVSIMVRIGDGFAPPACSDAISGRLEDLQSTLGEGPALDAHEGGGAVSEPDLAMAAGPRWPEFGRAAGRAGVRAVFSFPLRLGPARLGTLSAYRLEPGGLSGEEQGDARMIADLAVSALLGPRAVGLEGLTGPGAVVHQASGMVSVQIGGPIAEALVRLRAAAFAADRPLADVAGDVVAGRMRFGR